ncbi:MAG: hypothetical protein IJ741_02625 [Schwartzia sp.]|nr:hypothetical protein [Schwartzia sp. (in: firmicutes)]
MSNFAGLTEGAFLYVEIETEGLTEGVFCISFLLFDVGGKNPLLTRKRAGTGRKSFLRQPSFYPYAIRT